MLHKWCAKIEMSGSKPKGLRMWELRSLRYYAASRGNFLPNPKVSSPFGFLISEKGTDRLSRNVGKKLPLFFA